MSDGTFRSTRALKRELSSDPGGSLLSTPILNPPQTGRRQPPPRSARNPFPANAPMKRAAQPEEIAPAFVFLAAPSCSSYITGEILPIIGGY